MFNRVVFSMLCLAMVLKCAVALAVDQPLEPSGGRGGGPFTARCPPPSMLTAVELFTGDDVDEIRPICAVAYQPQQAGPATRYPTWFGGFGGRDLAHQIIERFRAV